MSKYTSFKEHIKTLGELGNIMTAMKNLSLIEINKVTKNISNQERVYQTINKIGADFLTSYPQYFTKIQIEQPAVYILIGSERGFCGGFNENITHELNCFDNQLEKYILIGRKLSSKLIDHPRVIKVIDGPNATEEIPNVILNLIQFLSELNILPNQWKIIYNIENLNKINTNLLQPFEEFKSIKPAHFSFPPVINQSKEDFLFEFMNHYLFSLLNFIFYQSFSAENYQRLRHLKNSIDHLEKQKTVLKHHLSLLRQEEITEEIQIILLSVQAIIEEIK